MFQHHKKMNPMNKQEKYILSKEDKVKSDLDQKEKAVAQTQRYEKLKTQLTNYTMDNNKYRQKFEQYKQEKEDNGHRQEKERRRRRESRSGNR